MVNTKIRLIIFFAAKDGEALYRLGADCGSDHELLIAKFRLKLKKVGKTIRPFRYDLNQYIIQEEVTTPDQREKNARRQYGCLMRLYKQPRKEEK